MVWIDFYVVSSEFLKLASLKMVSMTFSYDSKYILQGK